MNHGIDVHTHVVPEHFPAYVGMGKNVPWPSMVHDNCGHAQVMISGKNYRRIGQAWTRVQGLWHAVAMVG